MLGKTGSGKSATGNTILGENKFMAGACLSSVTSKCDLQRVDKNGKIIEIMDCPGLYDTQKTQEEISVVIIQAVVCMHPGPHAILYIIRLGRYTAEEFGVFQRLKALFDDHITNYMIVLFTGGDDLEREKKTLADVMQHASKDLLQVVEECGNRCHVFNNIAKSKDRQVEKLFEEVRRIQRANGDRPHYNCPKFFLIGEDLEKEVRRRLAEVEKKDQEREQYIQELETRTSKAMTAIKNLKDQLKKKERKRRILEEKEKERRMKKEEQLLRELRRKEHELSEEKRKTKKRELQEQFYKERSDFLQILEEERRKDKELLEQAENEQKEWEETKRQKEREEQERRERAYREELNRMKDDIAQEKKQGWIARAARAVAAVTTAPFRALALGFS